MKVVNAFTAVFATLAFLTLGSLLLMVALHLLAAQDAIYRIQEIYSNPWKSIQAGALGLLFILVGLASAKAFIKGGRDSEVIIFQGDIGPIVISSLTIEDIVKKILKRFSLIKEWKTKTLIDGRNVEIRLRLVLWSGSDVPALLNSIQQEIRDRLRKILGSEGQLEIRCDVIRIEESQMDLREGAMLV